MIREGKFGPQEAISLITISIVTRVFFTSPSVITRVVGTAGWYMTIVSGATAILGFTIIYLLLKRYPEDDLISIYEITAGPYLGSFFSLSLCALFLLDTGILLREFTEVMKVYVLPLSPPSYIIGIGMLGIIVMGILGLETQARFARLVAPTLLGSYVLGLIIASQNYEIHRMRPFLGYGLTNTIISGISRNSIYGFAVIAAIIAKSLQGTKYIKKIGFTSIILSTLLISVGLLAFTLTFPYYSAQEVTSPLYQMTALIDFGRFFQRLDPLFLFIWNISTLIAASLSLYISASIYSKVFKINDISPIIIPFSVLVFTTAMIPEDLENIALGYVNMLREYSWIVIYTPVIICLIISLLKGGKDNKKQKVKNKKKYKKKKNLI